MSVILRLGFRYSLQWLDIHFLVRTFFICPVVEHAAAFCGSKRAFACMRSAPFQEGGHEFKEHGTNGAPCLSYVSSVNFELGLPIKSIRNDLTHRNILFVFPIAACALIYVFEVGNTPLHDAVEKGHLEVVAKLVDYGAPLSATNM